MISHVLDMLKSGCRINNQCWVALNASSDFYNMQSSNLTDIALAFCIAPGNFQSIFSKVSLIIALPNCKPLYSSLPPGEMWAFMMA